MQISAIEYHRSTAILHPFLSIKITAEDLVEQAMYVANAPKCCDESQQADNMLNMLGANVMNGDIYHTPEEHVKLEM